MKKILLLGKAGMLGQALMRAHDERKYYKGELIGLNKSDLDVGNPVAVAKTLHRYKPDCVINATGYTDVDAAEAHREEAFAINADAVQTLAKSCHELGVRFVHISTDYIFNGTRAKGYTENDNKNIGPVNVYGASKRKGEEHILEIMDTESSWYLIRTSWLYGSGGKNFVDTMLSLAREGKKEFKVVNDQYGNPTYTADLALRIFEMMYDMRGLLSGIYHVTNLVSGRWRASGITWYEFAKKIFSQAVKLGIIEHAPIITPCATSEFPRPANRPRYSSIINTKIPDLRLWDWALSEYLKTWYT